MKTFYSRTGLLIVCVAAVVAIAFSQLTLRGIRLDLTEDKLYSLSIGSKNILENLENPVAVELFFSEEATRDFPQLRNYAQQVKDLLAEYQLHAGDKLSLSYTDPEPFSEAEDRAVASGLSRAALTIGAPEIFFGLNASGPGDNQQQIAFLNPADEDRLEQELSKTIYLASREQKPKVGLLTKLQVNGGFDIQTRQPTQPWMAFQQLRQLFEVQSLGADVEQIPEDIGALVVAHPSELTDRQLYAIDQFVLRGGDLLLLIDPQAEADRLSMPGGSATSSNPQKLLEPWGLSMSEQVVVDRQHALSVGGGQGQRPVRHLGLYQYGPANFNSDNPILNDLKSLNFAMAGSLSFKETEGLNWQPLLHSSKQANTLSADKFAMLFDPSTLFEDFNPSGERYTVAGLLTGTFSSAFVDGAPVEEESEENEEKQSEQVEASEEEDMPEPVPHLSQSEKAAAVLVIADVDFLSDNMWIQVQNLFGQRVGRPFADNGAFFANAVDAMMGNADLMSLRSRARHHRPFTVVEDLQREAEQRFRDKERELNVRLQETESKLSELQQQKDGEEMLTLSEEQQQAIADFEQEQLLIRKQLREVQHQLSKDIDSLENWLKLLNILLLPLLLSAGLYSLFRLIRPKYKFAG